MPPEFGPVISMMGAGTGHHEIGGHRARREGQQEGVEQLFDLENRAFREVGETHFETEISGFHRKGPGGRVELEVADQLHNPSHRRRDFLKNAHHHAFHQLAAGQAVAVEDDLQTVPPPFHWTTVEGVLLLFAELHDLQAPKSPVGAHDSRQLDRRHAVVVIEKGDHPGVGLRILDAAPDGMEALQPGSGPFEFAGHEVDHRPEGPQDVEAEAGGFEPCVVA